MTIIVFLVDTSGSMNQRTHFGARPTLLDVAKDAVEKFLKFRQRDIASRGDRYMLLTFEESPNNVKAGWKESHIVFMNELKNLTASGMTTLGPALKNAFDLLNINRMQTGIDTYGQGRCPFFLEPSVIIVITDGGRLSNTSGVSDELNLPMHSSVPGSELTKEPFRWDQRLFSIVLRLTGTYNSPNDGITSLNTNFCVPSDESPINAMCDVTGGRSYCVTSQRTLMASIDQLIQRIHGGVVINFEKVGPDPPVIIPSDEEMPNNCDPNGHQNNNNSGSKNNNNTNNNNYINSSFNDVNGSTKSWHNTRKLIYVQRSAQKGYSVGHWPIPESFWPDLSCPTLQPRTAHPIVKFTCTNSEPAVIENLPFDKYELEPSPLTQFILSRKQPHIAWQVFVANSHKGTELGLPFGYLKASTNLSCVNLFVLPYNYPVLLPLLDELFKVHQGRPTKEWKIQFDNYLKTMPLYYAAPLKRALQRMGAPTLVPDNMENCLSYPVLNYLKKLKNLAKAEYEKLVASVGTGRPHQIEGTRVLPNDSKRRITELGLCSNPILCQRFASIKNELNDFPNFVIRFRDKHLNESKIQCYRNAFDINRHDLLDQIFRMRKNFLQRHTSSIRYQDEDQLHSLPISQMGNYQEYLKRMPVPLRELESTPVRQHMFGNPFKVDKNRAMMMIDETDIDMLGNNGSSAGQRIAKRSNSDMALGPKPKRKPGPLPRDIQFPLQRPLSPCPSPPPSPSPCSFSSTPSPIPPPLPTPPIPPTVKESVKSVTNGNHNVIRTKDIQTIPIIVNNDKQISVNNEISGPQLAQNALTLQSPAINSLQKTVCDTQIYDHNHILVNDDSETNELTVKAESVPTNSDNVIAVETKPLKNASFVPVNGRTSSNDIEEITNNHNEHNGIDGQHSYKKLHITADVIELKKFLFKQVRKPGRNYDELVRQISLTRGPLRDYLLDEVISEAKRFKRKSLIQLLTNSFTKN